MATSSDRIFSLDIIRGVAVMGIFSVNIIAFAMIEAAYFNPAIYGGTTGADGFTWAANLLLIDNRMRSLFSMLFGASMLLVVTRAEASGQSAATVHYRRMMVLLAIGLIHYFFIWFGDILSLYAVCGMFVFLFRGLPPRHLLIGGIISVLIGVALFGSFVTAGYALDAAAHAPGASQQVIDAWKMQFGDFAPTTQMIADDIALHRGSLWEISHEKLADWAGFITLTILFMPETIGLMLFGMAGYKSGFLTGEWSDAAYRRFALITVPLGLAAFGVAIWRDMASDFHPVTVFANMVLTTIPFRIPMAAGYAAIIILLSRRHGWLAQRIAATGRAAFTNYLGTSLIATFVFYGWGLGLYGTASRAQAWLLVPVVWTIMLLWSKPWLDRYQYGPLEWLWRSLSRGSLQPMRR